MKWLGLVGLVCLLVTGLVTPAAAQDVKRVEVAGGWNPYVLKYCIGVRLPRGGIPCETGAWAVATPVV